MAEHLYPGWPAPDLNTYIDQAEIKLPATDRIVDLMMYNGEETGGVANPWVATEAGVYEIQTQNQDAVVRLPIGELREMRSPRTGLAWCVNGTYLFFSLGNGKVQKYYNKNLADTGPDHDEGLPSNRTGEISALLSYPGSRVFAAVDGESNYSSILLLDETAWNDCTTRRRAATPWSIKSSKVYATAGCGSAKAARSSGCRWR